MFRGLVCIPVKTRPVNRAGKCPAVRCQEIFSGNFSLSVKSLFRGHRVNKKKQKLKVKI